MIEWWGPVIMEYYAATEGGGTSSLPAVAEQAGLGRPALEGIGDQGA